MNDSSECLLYDSDVTCQENCSDCNVFGSVETNTMYKLGYLSGLYTICCPACKRIKYKVTNKDMVQGDCTHCNLRKVKRNENI